MNKTISPFAWQSYNFLVEGAPKRTTLGIVTFYDIWASFSFQFYHKKRRRSLPSARISSAPPKVKACSWLTVKMKGQNPAKSSQAEVPSPSIGALLHQTRRAKPLIDKKTGAGTGSFPWQRDRALLMQLLGCSKQLAPFCFLLKEGLVFFFLKSMILTLADLLARTHPHFPQMPLLSRNRARASYFCAPRKLTSLHYKFRTRRAIYIVRFPLA